MKKLLIILLFFNLSYFNVYSIEPDVFIQSTVNKASQTLSKNISKQEKINELKFIAKETVDIKGIGSYTLGSNRKNLNDNQKKILELSLKENQAKFNLITYFLLLIFAVM